jgi:hypothetical protein
VACLAVIQKVKIEVVLETGCREHSIGLRR